jgi:Na+-transporting methylmalonyl-CoA/oxaloacetate decarboxylase gamma subunit
MVLIFLFIFILMLYTASQVVHDDCSSLSKADFTGAIAKEAGTNERTWWHRAIVMVLQSNDCGVTE